VLVIAIARFIVILLGGSKSQTFARANKSLAALRAGLFHAARILVGVT
jgi:hypothetical protein